MKLVPVALFAAMLVACATISSRPEELRRTWDAAQVRVLHGGIYAFGAMNAPSNQADLAKLAPGVRLPTVIYLHGCSGMDLEHQSRTMGKLLREGFAVIAPNSFALTNRSAVCGRGNRHVFSVRAAEAMFAAERARSLDWVDARNLFLIGHSEGGAGAAAYRGDQFNAIVISGFHCPDGLASGVPTLAVGYREDHQIRSAPRVCANATERFELQGTSHHALREEQVAQRVVDFLRRNLKK